MKFAVRHIKDKDGVVHRIICHVIDGTPQMTMARCNKVVVLRGVPNDFTSDDLSCIRCMTDEWEPS